MEYVRWLRPLLGVAGTRNHEVIGSDLENWKGRNSDDKKVERGESTASGSSINQKSLPG